MDVAEKASQILTISSISQQRFPHLFGKPSSATHVAIFATVHDDLAFAYTKMNSTYLPRKWMRGD